MKLAIVGHGRMGRSIATLAQERGHSVVAVVEGQGRLGEAAARGAEVAFEFTRPNAAASNVAGLIGCGVSVVCGTTGWSPGPQLIDSAGKAGVGVVLAPNFSMGVNLFARVLGQAARTLSAMPDLQPLLYEVHHRGKKDSPSGTARMLAQLIVEQSSTVDRVVEGTADGGLPPRALQVSGLRTGSEPGTHVVRFDGSCETITMEHRARNRDGFSRGAIVAAEWLSGRSGWFSFDDVMESVLRGECTPWEVA